MSLDPGERAVRWINNLTHTQGEWAGQPFRLRPWQESIIRALFGVRNPDGTRQYRTCYIEIPRKNGKTGLAAAIALYMLLGDREPGGEVYSAACDLEQASLAFNIAAQMVHNDPELAAQTQIIPSRRRIVHAASGSIYRAIPADAPSAHGYNASAVIYDELHAAPNRELWDVLTSSMGARRQPLTVVITTAGFDRESICWELHRYAEQVRDGVIPDSTFLPVLYGAPKEADWTDEAVWRIANPALGDFRSLDEMRVMAAQARELPGRQNAFRRLYLCQWTEQSSRAIDLTRWDACAGPANLADLRGRRCYAGLDLASTADVAALVLDFPDDEHGHVVIPRFWVPEENLRRRALRDRVPYDVWHREGYLTATPGNVIDYDIIRADLNALSQEVEIAEIAIDRWNATQIATQLTGDGFTLVAFGQGFASMAAPTKELLRIVAAGELAHGGHPVLRWMASNLSVRQDAAGNLKPDKATSGEKIDGIVALVMALDRASRHGGERSVYETRGPLMIGGRVEPAEESAAR